MKECLNKQKLSTQLENGTKRLGFQCVLFELYALRE